MNPKYFYLQKENNAFLQRILEDDLTKSEKGTRLPEYHQVLMIVLVMVVLTIIVGKAVLLLLLHNNKEENNNNKVGKTTTNKEATITNI